MAPEEVRGLVLADLSRHTPSTVVQRGRFDRDAPGLAGPLEVAAR